MNNKTPMQTKKMFCFDCNKIMEFTAIPDYGTACECGYLQDSTTQGAYELCMAATWHDVKAYNTMAIIAKCGGYIVPVSPPNFHVLDC